MPKADVGSAPLTAVSASLDAAAAENHKTGVGAPPALAPG